MARKIRVGNISVLERTAAVPGSSTGLHEIPELRTEQDVATNIYTGKLYIRHFTCPKNSVAAAFAGDLALGAVMPVAWGGVATANPEDPRLQRGYRKQQSGGAMDGLVAEFLKINIR